MDHVLVAVFRRHHDSASRLHVWPSRRRDPVLAGPLEERGLLHALEPKDWLDQKTTAGLANIIFEMLTNGAFDGLAEPSHFTELSQSRMGYAADAELGSFHVDELQQRGLAKPSEDGVSIPLLPTVRTAILVTLGQLSQNMGVRRGMTIHPTSNYGHADSELIQTLSMQAMPFRHHAVQLDMEPVTCDLSYIPLKDVLQFRREHQDAYRAYMSDLHGYMVKIAGVDEGVDRELLLLERQQELSDQAHDLQRMTRRELQKSQAAWSLGIAGGVWSFSTGGPIGLALSTIEFIPGFASTGSKKLGTYTYIFDTGKTFQSD